MTSSTNVLGSNPIWYFADTTGKPLGGGYMATQLQSNPEQQNLVYTDGTNNYPWPYDNIPNQNRLGIAFDMNGEQGPFYFNPTVPYFFEIYDSTGTLVLTIGNYLPPSGGGGGPPVTNAVDLSNKIVNSVMYRNTGVTPIATAAALRIAPGAHSGFALTTPQLSLPANAAGPDIYFLKNNLNANDTIAFPKITPLGDTSFFPDSTTVDYLEYTCTNSPATETQKCVQFPITRSVQNLSNLPVIVTLWARSLGGNTTLTLNWRQFFGDGGGSADNVFSFSILNLTSAWTRFRVPTTIPSVTGQTLGFCGNDALFLQLQFPFGVPCTIDFTKVCMYINDLNLSPNTDYQSYDEIDGVINAPRTGYVFSSYDLVAPPGYLMLDDTTIGLSNASTHFGTDYFPLYNWLWTNVSQPSANVNCPVTGGLGVSAPADFVANKPLALPRALGRVLSGSGTGAGLSNKVIGSFDGEQSHTMQLTELVSHVHQIQLYQVTPGNSQVNNFDTGTFNNSVNTQPTGGGQPFNVIQPTSYLNYFIKL